MSVASGATTQGVEDCADTRAVGAALAAVARHCLIGLCPSRRTGASPMGGLAGNSPLLMWAGVEGGSAQTPARRWKYRHLLLQIVQILIYCLLQIV